MLVLTLGYLAALRTDLETVLCHCYICVCVCVWACMTLYWLHGGLIDCRCAVIQISFPLKRDVHPSNNLIVSTHMWQLLDASTFFASPSLLHARTHTHTESIHSSLSASGAQHIEKMHLCWSNTTALEFILRFRTMKEFQVSNMVLRASD